MQILPRVEIFLICYLTYDYDHEKASYNRLQKLVSFHSSLSVSDVALLIILSCGCVVGSKRVARTLKTLSNTDDLSWFGLLSPTSTV